MDWREALEIVVGRTKHEAYRAACEESHPEYVAYRLRMIEMATGVPAGPPRRTPAAFVPTQEQPPSQHRCPYLDSCLCHKANGPICIHQANGPLFGSRPVPGGWKAARCDECPEHPANREARP